MTNGRLADARLRIEIRLESPASNSTLLSMRLRLPLVGRNTTWLSTCWACPAIWSKAKSESPIRTATPSLVASFRGTGVGVAEGGGETFGPAVWVGGVAAVSF